MITKCFLVVVVVFPLNSNLTYIVHVEGIGVYVRETKNEIPSTKSIHLICFPFALVYNIVEIQKGKFLQSSHEDYKSMRLRDIHPVDNLENSIGSEQLIYGLRDESGSLVYFIWF